MLKNQQKKNQQKWKVYSIDGATDDTLTFIDDEVRIPHFEDCKYAREEDQVGNIALGCIGKLLFINSPLDGWIIRLFLI